jgi:ubiquitin carboxyl-terminal hydrolase 25/28
MKIPQEDDWLPPSPDPAAETPFENPINILLDDVEKELLVHKSQRPAIEQRASSVQFKTISAMKDLMKVLGCMDCEKYFFLVLIVPKLTRI